MKKIIISLNCIEILALFIIAGLPVTGIAGEPQLSGHWIVNFELSDDPDVRVEKAIKEAGGRIGKTDKKGRGRYKGGPKEQELYDHLSYDEDLFIQQEEPRFHFRYQDGFERVFYSDNRGRSVSASDLQSGERKDYAFAYWEDDKLVVEGRPRDGGKTIESYQVDPVTGRLKVELELKPLSFLYPVEIKLVYDRAPVVD